MPSNIVYDSTPKKTLSLPWKLAAFGGILAVVGLAVGLGVGLKGKAKTSPQPKDYDSIWQIVSDTSCNDGAVDCDTKKYICANTCKTDSWSYVHNEEEDNNEAASHLGFDNGCEDVKNYFSCEDSEAFYGESLGDRRIVHWLCPATCNYDLEGLSTSTEEPTTPETGLGEYIGPGMCGGEKTYAGYLPNSKECWIMCKDNNHENKYSAWDYSLKHCYCYHACDEMQCSLSKSYTTHFNTTTSAMPSSCDHVSLTTFTDTGNCGNEDGQFINVNVNFTDEDCWDECKLNFSDDYTFSSIQQFEDRNYCVCYNTCNWICDNSNNAPEITTMYAQTDKIDFNCT